MAVLAAAVGAWPARGFEAADAVAAGRFRFLNREEELAEIDWLGRHVSHLWSYNLHYFDYALDLAHAYRASGDARYVRRLEALADGWIAATRGARGDGWEPYAVSLRVVNWAYALLLLGDAVAPPVRARMEESLLAQLGFLERRLELHILANHLQKNLKALVVGGLYFDGPAARRWLRRGTALLWRELMEQVLPDGTHYERSPMYHAIALGDFLETVDLLRAAGEPVPEECARRVARMAEAFGTLSRPSGAIHLFNDAAHGIAPERAWLDGMARRVCGLSIPDPRGCLALPDGGYWGWAGADERLLVDCGEPGPAYQPGHAHCDLLSFELDLAGRAVVVDAGVSGYDGDPLRAYVRGTRAHNTVMVDGREQSEMWGDFRVARRATVRGGAAKCGADGFTFRGAYSPYHDPAAVHHREIRRTAGAWEVRDRVEGARGKRLVSFLHLHPDFAARLDDGVIVAHAGALEVRVHPFGAHRVAIRRGEAGQGWHAPEFGVALPAAAIEMEVEANDGRAFGYHIRTNQRELGT